MEELRNELERALSDIQNGYFNEDKAALKLAFARIEHAIAWIENDGDHKFVGDRDYKCVVDEMRVNRGFLI